MPHNMTVTIEDPLWEDMKKHEDIRWGAVMKSAVKEKIRALSVLEKLMAKSKLSEKEIREFSVSLGKRVNTAR